LAKDVIKTLNVFMKVFVTSKERGVKYYSIREMIDYSQTGRKK